jgi:C4-dicarboxylate-binding protein DctP
MMTTEKTFKMMRMATIALVAGVLAFGMTPPAQAKEIVIKFSHVTSGKKHPKYLAAEEFAKRVNTRMKGKVRVEVYPGGQLFNDTRVLIELIKGRSVQMAAPSLSKFETFTKKFRVFDLPFLFNDIKAVNKFQQSKHGKAILKSLDKKGILGLSYWHNGMKQMSAKKPLIKPSDAKGLKFRVQQSDVLVAQFRQLGATPQKMAFKEVYGALQQGVVDGQENTWSNIYSKKFFEVQDGVTETDHGIIDYAVIVSKRFWTNLPKGIRKQLEQILAEVTRDRNALSRKLNLANRAKVIAAGGKVRTLSAAQRKAWRTAMKPVWDKFAKGIGKNLIKAAEASNK